MHPPRSKSRPFWILMAFFVVAVIVFYDRPSIAMWIGFALAGYSAIANDSIQTLGTFLASNAKRPWWLLWLYIGGILSAVFIWGWTQGDPSFGRLDEIPEPTEFSVWQLLAPVALLCITQLKMPVSTTFLLLSVFSSPKTISSMITKSFIGYFVAFISALIIWAIIAECMKHKVFFKETYSRPFWTFLQWFSTAYLWGTWLMQDTANIMVFLPRDIHANQLGLILVTLLGLMGVLLYFKGGKIQEIVMEKTDMVDIRSATIIDFVLATVLLVFQSWNNIPMSTTWVFLGLLAGREISLARLSGKEKPYLRTLGLVTKDLGFASIGLVVSIGFAWLSRVNFLVG